MTTLTQIDIVPNIGTVFIAFPGILNATVDITNPGLISSTPIVVNIQSASFATASPLNIAVPVGNPTITLSFTNEGDLVPVPPNDGSAASVTFYLDGVAQSPSVPLIFQSVTNTYFASQQFNIVCLHASSIIITTEGKKFIKDIVIGNKVLTANGEYAEVKSVAQCWIKHPGPSHDAVIFEQFSLTSDLPSERLIIDPGHPIKIKNEDKFRPAGEFVTKESIDSNKIFVTKWTDERIQSPTPSIRWDLVLEDSFDNYIANGIIVKSRKNPLNAGYRHSYRKWI